MQVRQGDVLIVRVHEISEGDRKPADPNERIVVAHGEVTGHAHTLVGGPVQAYYKQDGQIVGAEIKSDTELRHNTHAPVPLKSGGKFRLVRQREWGAFGPRTVAD